MLFTRETDTRWPIAFLLKIESYQLYATHYTNKNTSIYIYHCNIFSTSNDCQLFFIRFLQCVMMMMIYWMSIRLITEININQLHVRKLCPWPRTAAQFQIYFFHLWCFAFCFLLAWLIVIWALVLQKATGKIVTNLPIYKSNTLTSVFDR